MLTMLILNGTLTPRQTSQTYALIQKFNEEVYKYSPCEVEVLDLIELRLNKVTGEGDGTDDWPALKAKLLAADIVVFATPIWWNNHSSLIQRVIERMDDMTDRSGYGNTIVDKVAGFLINGAEDGGQHVQGGLMEVMTYFGFVLPAQCAYFDLHQGPSDMSEIAITAKNLIRMASLLKSSPR